MDKHLSYIMTITINSLTDTQNVIIMDLDTQRIITEREFDSSNAKEIVINLKTFFLWYQPLVMIINSKSSINLTDTLAESSTETRTNTELKGFKSIYTETANDYVTNVYVPNTSGE